MWHSRVCQDVIATQVQKCSRSAHTLQHGSNALSSCKGLGMGSGSELLEEQLEANHHPAQEAQFPCSQRLGVWVVKPGSFSWTGQRSLCSK